MIFPRDKDKGRENQAKNSRLNVSKRPVWAEVYDYRRVSGVGLVLNTVVFQSKLTLLRSKVTLL